MKYLLFVLLLVVVLITAGCVGGNQNSAVTPTPQIVNMTVLVTPTPIIITSTTPELKPTPTQISDAVKERAEQLEKIEGYGGTGSRFFVSEEFQNLSRTNATLAQEMKNYWSKAWESFKYSGQEYHPGSAANELNLGWAPPEIVDQAPRMLNDKLIYGKQVNLTEAYLRIKH